MKKRVCEYCGANMVEYKHSLSKALVIGLSRIYDHGKPVNLKRLKLTRSQWDNFQKLRYWDLVEQWVDTKGKRKSGFWRITKIGKDFVTCKKKVMKSVWTYRGETVRFDGKMIDISDVDVNYKTRPEYAMEAVVHRGV